MKHVIVALGLLLPVACAQHAAEETDPNNTPGLENAPAIPATSPPKSGEVKEVGTEISILPPQTRPRRRMNIDQIEAAFLRATDLTWVDLKKDMSKAVTKYLEGESWSDQGDRLFESLAQALGKPDHISVTQEDLTISPLFVKYLNDAARRVCGTRAYIDAGPNTPAEKRQLIVGVEPLTDDFKSNPEGMNKAFKRMLLLYLGMRPTPTQLAQWQTLFETAAEEAKQPVSGWITVCTAALTHPAFYTF